MRRAHALLISSIAATACGASSAPARPGIQNVPAADQAQTNTSTSEKACRQKPVVLQKYKVSGRGPYQDHWGVDFRVCAGQHVVFVGDGKVIGVFHEPEASTR